VSRPETFHPSDKPLNTNPDSSCIVLQISMEIIIPEEVPICPPRLMTGLPPDAVIIMTTIAGPNHCPVKGDTGTKSNPRSVARPAGLQAHSHKRLTRYTAITARRE